MRCLHRQQTARSRLSGRGGAALQVEAPRPTRLISVQQQRAAATSSSSSAPCCHAGSAQPSPAAASRHHLRSAVRASAAASGRGGSATVMTVTRRDSKDLLIVGPGVLGSYAGQLWRSLHPSARVIAVTNSTNSHERLTKMGLQPLVKSSLTAGDRYPFVLFSAPPSGSQDYAKEVAAAMTLWDNSLPDSCFVFTSSMGVCSVDDGSVVREDCPVVPEGASPSTDKLLAAEDLVLRAGGNVLRLVGLYHANRGAHTYFFKVQQVPRPGDYVVNLLHYEDAADLAVQVLNGSGSGPFRHKVFLGSDNNPVTFKDMMDACQASPRFAGQAPVTFTQPDGGPNRSKRADNTATRQLLGGWAPKYSSFASFMRDNKGEDFYTTSGLFP